MLLIVIAVDIMLLLNKFDLTNCADLTISIYSIVEENYSESVTIVRRQSLEGGFHNRKKYSKN